MYQKLATGPNRPSYDVWVVDGHALGALAAAEDTGVHLVILCSSMPSEFMHTVQKFQLETQVLLPCTVCAAALYSLCCCPVLSVLLPCALCAAMVAPYPLYCCVRCCDCCWLPVLLRCEFCCCVCSLLCVLSALLVLLF